LLYTAEKEIPFLFKHTTAFLNYIASYKTTTEDTILVTMDVVSLYTNIPHQEAILYIIEQYSETLPLWDSNKLGIVSVDINTLQNLLNLMLTNCTFEINGSFFSQNYGTPMGHQLVSG